MLILGGVGLSGGNEHVWLFTRPVLLPLESSSAHESTNFVMLHAALQGVLSATVLFVKVLTQGLSVLLRVA